MKFPEDLKTTYHLKLTLTNATDKELGRVVHVYAGDRLLGDFFLDAEDVRVLYLTDVIKDIFGEVLQAHLCMKRPPRHRVSLEFAD